LRRELSYVFSGLTGSIVEIFYSFLKIGFYTLYQSRDNLGELLVEGNILSCDVLAKCKLA